MLNFSGKKVIVTGGAGFIGSHIVARLLEEKAIVTVIDNLSSGHIQFIEHLLPCLRFVKADLMEAEALQTIFEGQEAVFHFSANADVRGGVKNTSIDLQQNIIVTHNVLEACRRHGIKTFVFASSATIYGEPDIFPTPEHISFAQTSLYGASKRSCEALIEAYSEYFGMRSFIFRFVSWIGEHYTHGVIYDFLNKISKNPRQLEILGNGRQKKSYLYVKDGVDGIFTALKESRDQKNVFNLGHHEACDVMAVARIVSDAVGLPEISLVFSGGERGWLGDSPIVHLDTTRINSLGWSPKISIEEGIRRTAAYLLSNPAILEYRDRTHA
jgi:UDP-glucose 4-epimerase